MKTIQAIVELAHGDHSGQPMAMATVVNVRGSAYRRPGARMFIAPDGKAVGTISGGCLESDVRERAAAVMASGKPNVVTYDSTAPDDIVFGLGLGCNGVVQILIEPLATHNTDGLIAFFAACVARRQPGRIATVFRSELIPPGSRLMRWPDGSVTSNFLDPALTEALLACFDETANRRTAIRSLELPDGRDAGVLIETISPPTPLVIFGAGDDAVPLATLAKSIGWHVTVIDARPAFPTVARFPMADAVHCLETSLLESHPDVAFPPTTLAMIMTHSFVRDRELLRFLLARPLPYVGILGPKKRTRHLLDDLGFAHPPDGLHGPAGLDIGAETPEEIAISILSQMQAILARRGGGALQDRDGPIHDPVDQPLP
ncbi:MAG: XdhC family protein [Verrucomicrobiota bacterium]